MTALILLLTALVELALWLVHRSSPLRSHSLPVRDRNLPGRNLLRKDPQLSYSHPAATRLVLPAVKRRAV